MGRTTVSDGIQEPVRIRSASNHSPELGGIYGSRLAAHLESAARVKAPLRCRTSNYHNDIRVGANPTRRSQIRAEHGSARTLAATRV